MDKIGDLDRAIAEIFSERDQISIKKKANVPDFDSGAISEIFNESLPTTPSEPTPSPFDHQALVEIFGEPLSAPTVSAPLGVNEKRSSPENPSRREPSESIAPVDSFSASTQRVTPQRSESLLAMMRNLFAMRATTPAPHPDEASSAPLPSGKLHATPTVTVSSPSSSADTEHVPVRAEKEPRTEARTGVERALSVGRSSDLPDHSGDLAPHSGVNTAPLPQEQSAEVEATAPISPDLSSGSSALGNQSPPPSVPNGLGEATPAPGMVAVQTEQESGRPAASPIPKRSSPVLRGASPPPPWSDESARQIRFRQPDDSNVAMDAVAVGPGSVGPAASPSAATTRESACLEQHGTSPGNEPYRQLDRVESAEADLSRTAGAAELSPTTMPLSVAPPETTESAVIGLRNAAPCPSSKSPDIPESKQSPPTNDPDHLASVAEIAVAILAGDADSAGREPPAPSPAGVQPFHGRPSTIPSAGRLPTKPADEPVAAVPRVHVEAIRRYEATTSASTSPDRGKDSPHLEGARPHLARAAPSGRVEPAAESFSHHLSRATQIEPSSQTASLQAETSSSVLDTLPVHVSSAKAGEHRIRHDQPDEMRAGMTAINAVHPMTPKPEPHSSLAELDLEAAVRLRWVMRDIRANRLGMSPVSADDLATLVELGLVDTQGQLPILTAAGTRELS